MTTEHTSTDQAASPLGSASSEGLGAGAGARSYPACKGRNCGCTDGVSHSPECQQEHEDAIAGVLGRLPPTRGWLAWRKPDDMELAWTSMDMNSKVLDQSISATNAERVGHPTQKPLRVMAWSLSFAPDARTVCDPFMGSGTVGVACAQIGRAFVGIERDRKYFEMACQRIEQAQAQGALIPAETAGAPQQVGLELEP